MTGERRYTFDLSGQLDMVANSQANVKLQAEFSVSERRAYQAINQPRSSQRYEGQPRGEERVLVKTDVGIGARVAAVRLSPDSRFAAL